MARKPVDLTRADGATSGRDAIWIAIRALRVFTLAELEHHVMSKQPRRVRTHPDTIRTYVVSLERAGYLRRLPKRPRQGDASGRYAANRWELVRDTGIETPRVRRDGTPVTQGRAREQMWTTMRILGDFDYRDLAVAASTEEHNVNPEDAKDYIKHLLKAGYLVRKTKPMPGQPARYRLLPSMDTGPRAPMVQRVKQVFDPNLNQVVWPNGEARP